MMYRISCSDFGKTDGFQVTGKTKSDVLKKVMSHMKKDHMMTSMELEDPKMMKNLNQNMWMRA